MTGQGLTGLQATGSEWAAVGRTRVRVCVWSHLPYRSSNASDLARIETVLSTLRSSLKEAQEEAAHAHSPAQTNSDAPGKTRSSKGKSSHSKHRVAAGVSRQQEWS
jgi:hypothetical protein